MIEKQDCYLLVKVAQDPRSPSGSRDCTLQELNLAGVVHQNGFAHGEVLPKIQSYIECVFLTRSLRNFNLRLGGRVHT